MLHEILVLSLDVRLHAGIALLPSNSRVSSGLLLSALDDLPRLVDHFVNHCFRWVPVSTWEEVVVPPLVLP